jgi:hypothetical protein
MDAIGNDNIALRKVSTSIPLSSLSNHLNGKTWTKKVRIEKVLITKEDVKIVTWILAILEIGLSINLQQLKLKVAKII